MIIFKNFFIYIMISIIGFFISGVSLYAKERVYYISAEEVLWDYAPSKRDIMMGKPLNDAQKVFVEKGSERIGSKYKKAIFIEYTDSSFTKKKEVSEEWIHKQILGPVIRAAVGDTIKIVFKNMASRPYSIHPHGVFYDKASEGAMTNDETSGKDKKDDAIAPGGTYIYHWNVPERAGPGPKDGSSIAWLYHSHVNEIMDTNTGLIGIMIITAKGQADRFARPKDIDREFIILFKVFDENESWYLDESINISRKGMVDKYKGKDFKELDLEEEDFKESNLLHTINGRLFGDWPMPRMYKGEHVRWYIVGFGNEVDMHTAHWHGNTGLAHGMRLDTVSVFPASIVSVDMTPDNTGIWMFHCHVDDHLKAGMTGRYQVLDPEEKR